MMALVQLDDADVCRFFRLLVSFGNARTLRIELVIKMLFIEQDYTERREKTITNEIKRSPTQNSLRLNANEQKPKERSLAASFCRSRSSVDISSCEKRQQIRGLPYACLQTAAAFSISDFICTGSPCE